MSTHACLCVYARRQGDRCLPCCRQVGGYILGRTSASARRRAAEKVRGVEGGEEFFKVGTAHP